MGCSPPMQSPMPPRWRVVRRFAVMFACIERRQPGTKAADIEGMRQDKLQSG